MIINYSSLNRYETPNLTLCNPGSVNSMGLNSKAIGILNNVSDMEIIFNFNAVSELNFRVTLVKLEDEEENEHVVSLYRNIQNRRLVFVDCIGYFTITSVTDGYENGIQHKDVKAESIDAELQQKMIPYIADGTYRFSSDAQSNTKGLLETIVETIPLWTIGHVDREIASRYRTFEDVDTSLNCLGFMLTNMQEAYECIFIFDPARRIINVYDQNNYVMKTDVYISKRDLINSINITENADDIYTAISVLGGDNIAISALNPTGASVLYNFNYYLDWMSPELREKVIAWQNRIDECDETYSGYAMGYYTAWEQVANLDLEKERLRTQLTMYKRCKDNIIAESDTSFVDEYNKVIESNGGTPISISGEIDSVRAQIDDLMHAAQDSLDAASGASMEPMKNMYYCQNSMKLIRDECSIESHFTEDEIAELSNYIFEGSYNDEYVVITDIMTQSEKFAQMKILYDRAKKQLQRISAPKQEFTIDVENFIFSKEFESWSAQLETGCLINVEIDEDETALLFLSSMTVNYEDHSLSMTFGNNFNKFDPKSLFDNVLGNISKSANTLNFIKEILYPIKNGEFNAVKEALQTSRNLAMNAALTATNEEVIIDGSGYTGRKRRSDGTLDPSQVKITGKTLAFTDDSWETCRVAIGDIPLGDGVSTYGVNAETIIGDMIMGNNLRIMVDDENTDTPRDILSVMDDKVSISVSSMDSALRSATHDMDEKVNNVAANLANTQNDIIQLRTDINVIPGQIDFLLSSVEVLNNKEIDHVTTTTGYTFNRDGLSIWKNGDEIQNLIDHTGMYVKRSGDNVLVANNDGVEAINLTSRQYLIVGNNSRFEDYDNGSDHNRTACFYIGE